MSQGDMFLKLESAQAGPVRGEVEVPEHFGEMAVQDWSWGMKSGSAMGGGRASRTALSELRIVRSVDAASTALMSVMRNNDRITRAVLSSRKAGGENPLDFFVVTIERGRITSYDVACSGEPGILVETISVAFEKVEIKYQKQSETGGKLAASTFATDVGPV